MSPAGSPVDSWRVWSMPALQVPELYTVQVWAGHHGGLRVAPWWGVRVWCHWVPHWWDGVGGARRVVSLGAARKEARRVVELLGGRCYQGGQVISTDATVVQDRWTVVPVDPAPPWCARWPGPQDWRAQLVSTPGPWGG